MLLLLACTSSSDSSFPDSDSAPSDSSDSQACADKSTGEGQDPLSLSGNSSCAIALYQDACVDCHGPDGLGTDLGPSLLEHVHCHTDAELLMVLTGQRPKMPDPGLGPQQLADVLVWLRETYGDYTGPEDVTCPES